MKVFDTFQIPAWGFVSAEPLRIYTGLLGQIGDIVMFSATVRRLRQLFPRATITFAVSRQYREAGELVAGLPYVDRLFVTELYFEKLTPALFQPWERGWPVDFRGEDEVVEQRRHDLVLETRPRHRREPWWGFAHQVEELAHQVAVPGPIDRRTEIAIPEGTVIPTAAVGRIVLHNDPAIDPVKAWPWEAVERVVRALGPEQVVLLGHPGPAVPGALDLRGQTTLAQAAAIIASGRCYVGIDSGLMWVAGSLQVPTVGLYGTSYVPAYGAIQPLNPRAVYLQAEGRLDQIRPETVLAAVAQLLGADGAPPAAALATEALASGSGRRQP
jgi:Glycosyltransferase family 9 (heptosyltransferase)